MNYSLGNMLSNGGALNPDGLALDLQFAADKTLTARRGPTPTFTRASTATFVGSNGLIQSAAINAPRFDHNPVTLASRGLLIEESRTNLIRRSEEFNVSPWGANAAMSITPNSVTAPDGTLTADTVTNSVASANFLIQAVSVVAGSTYTLSFYARSGTATSTIARIFNDTSGGQFASIDYSSLTSSSEWRRISLSFTIPAGCLSISIRIRNDDGVGSVHLWGAQLELGSFPTSYIPTTTTALTRSADVCSITGSNFSGFYNQSEGTMLANAFTPASGDRTVLAADDNTANEMIRLRTEGTNPFFKVTDGGSDVVAIDAGTVTANTAFKLIGAYKVNDFASSINGGSAVTDTTGTIPTVDRMRIGAGQGGNTMCGCISAIRYFKKRLPDAKLQSLTT
jgi:hypothetical protein